MDSKIKVFWTDTAIHNLENLLDYLSLKWTEKETNKFKELLSKQINLIHQYPTIFPISEQYPRLRKAVLSKQTIVFYEIRDRKIYIVYIFCTYQNPDKLF